MCIPFVCRYFCGYISLAPAPNRLHASENSISTAYYIQIFECATIYLLMIWHHSNENEIKFNATIVMYVAGILIHLIVIISLHRIAIYLLYGVQFFSAICKCDEHVSMIRAVLSGTDSILSYVGCARVCFFLFTIHFIRNSHFYNRQKKTHNFIYKTINKMHSPTHTHTRTQN